MSESRAHRRKLGRLGQPKIISPVCRKGVGTSTVVQGKREGGVDRDGEIQYRQQKLQDNWGGRRLLPGYPPSPTSN